MKNEYVTFSEQYRKWMSEYFEENVKQTLEDTTKEDKKKVECLLDFLTNGTFYKVISKSESTAILEVPSDLHEYLKSIITDVRFSKGLAVPIEGIVKLDESVVEKYRSEIKRFWNENS